MKKRNILIFPLSLVCLAALTGCKNPDQPTPQEDDPTVVFDTEIDKEFNLPSSYESLSEYEASALRDELVNSLQKKNVLTGIESKITSKSNLSKIYTGSYKKYITDEEYRYTIKSKQYYNREGGEYPIITIDTKKNIKETIDSVSTYDNLERTDVIYYCNSAFFDNIDYKYDQFGGIKGQITAENCVPTDIIINYQRNQLGNDGESSDIYNFFKENDTSYYCIKNYNETEEIVNPLSPSVTIKKTTSTDIIMHFERGDRGLLPSSYAYKESVYYDRDLSGQVFADKTLVEEYKYVNKGDYSTKIEYSGDTLEPYETVSNYPYLNRYLPKDDSGIEGIYDNDFYMDDVTLIDQAISGNDDYVYTFTNGYKEDLEKEKIILSEHGSYDNHNPLYMIETLRSDNSITNRFKRMTTSCALSAGYRYNFSVFYDGASKSKDIAKKDINYDPQFIEFDSDGKYFKVKKSGEYSITMKINKNLTKATVYINHIIDSEDCDSATYCSVSSTFSEDVSLGYEYLDRETEEVKSITFESGSDYSYNVINPIPNNDNYKIKVAKKESVTAGYVLPSKNIQILDKTYKEDGYDVTYDSKYTGTCFSDGVFNFDSSNPCIDLHSSDSVIHKFDIKVGKLIDSKNLRKIYNFDGLYLDNLDNDEFARGYDYTDTNGTVFSVKTYDSSNKVVIPENVILVDEDGEPLTEYTQEIAVDKETGCFTLTSAIAQAIKDVSGNIYVAPAESK